MEVLTNASAFCLQQGKGALGCANDQAAALSGLAHAGAGGRPAQGPSYWHFVDIEAGRSVATVTPRPSAARPPIACPPLACCRLRYFPVRSAPNELVVDLARANGTAFAIRYGWTGDCCSEHPPTADPCPIASCPVMGSSSNLPANPFVAHIVDGKCKCVAPQVCDE